MIAAIYSRKSIFTSKGESIENQIKLCKEYGNKIGIQKYILYEDEGFSGGNTNRPSFQKLIRDAKAKKFNFLICYRLDRISRNVADFSSTLELLQKNNISFISIKEQFDTTSPIGKAMVYIASVFAQLERETISERVKDNMLELAKTGRWLGGQTPLGFHSEKILYLDHNYQEKYMYKLSPIESELNLVKLIFNKYLEFKSLRKVNNYLLENNFKTKLKCNFNIRTISDILSNPTYVIANEAVFNYLKNLGINCVGIPDNKHGILTYNKKNEKNKYKDTSKWLAAISKHEGIIDASTWLKVQSILNSNKINSPRLGKTHNALLTGILRCAKCGSPMTVIHGTKNKFGSKFFYYSCSMKIASKGSKCNNKNIRTDKLESALLNNLNKHILISFSHLSKTFYNHLKYSSNSKDPNIELNLFKKTIKENEMAIKNLINQLSQNKTSVAGKYIIKEIEAKENIINNTKKQILTYKNSKINLSNNNIHVICHDLKKISYFTEKLEDKYKKILFHYLIKKIIWDASIETISIYLK
ncbi:recombinase family protein [Clostridium rectalis]|uniref:recombinase family protein n=1 Tax=Clostridium rectalis TaxID=2040295 RepID=UPI000F63D538|nr:recombinase family protein [Clostridium rectalis]